jgi:beta-xylosidase
MIGLIMFGLMLAPPLVARRQRAHCYSASTAIDLEPQRYQQQAGLICYYNGSKFHCLYVSAGTVRGEHSLRRSCAPGPPNFTRAFVGMSCQDYAGTGNPADFDYFEYHEREFSAAPYRSSLQVDTLNSFQERTR